MSKWDEPVKPEALIVGVFAVAIFAIGAVPLALMFCLLASLVGIGGGTQDAWTIIGSFVLVAILGSCSIAYVMWKVQ